MPDYRWRWNNYQHPALVAAFDMSTRTPGGLMKNLALTGSTYDATINGALVLANPLIRAKSTKCMDFDGATNYLSLANPVNGLTAFSIVYWVNEDVLNGMTFSRAGVAGTYLYIDTPGRVVFRVGGAAAGPVGVSLHPINNTYMVVGVFGAVNPQFRIMVNGKIERDNAGVFGANPVDANCFVGQYWDGSLRLNGRLDNILFYNIALDAAKVNAIWRSSLPRM